jgi:hypothetical protein
VVEQEAEEEDVGDDRRDEQSAKERERDLGPGQRERRVEQNKAERDDAADQPGEGRASSQREQQDERGAQGE